MYLTILIINLGGHVDEIFRSQIAFQVGLMIYDGWPEGVEEPERTEIIEQTIWAMEEAKGLHRPFLERSGRWLVQALTLDLSERRAGFHAQVGNVQALIRERLPYTLLLVGISNVVLFMATISAALVLSRKHGGLLDRLNVLLLSLTSAPSWIHGVVLLLIFAGTLHILPFPRRWDQLPDRFTLDYALLMLRYMILPAAAIVVSGFFQGVYAWRAFFLIFRHEDYVEIARAKGLRPGAIERSYILRPTLPYVLTNFATMLIVFWQGAIALEMVFLWPGIGPLFMQAVRFFDTPLLLGIVVIFAYLLALTVFLLDIIYALVDPRVRVGSAGTGSRLRSARTGRRLAVRPRRWPAEAVARLRATGAWFASLAGRLGTTGSGWRARRRTPIENSERPAAEGKPAGTWRERLAQLGPALREVARSPSALLGAAVILGMLAVSIYVVIALPRDEVVTLWRGQGSDVTRALWYRNPKNAPPAWTNLFRGRTRCHRRSRCAPGRGRPPPWRRTWPWITGWRAARWPAAAECRHRRRRQRVGGHPVAGVQLSVPHLSAGRGDLSRRRVCDQETARTFDLGDAGRGGDQPGHDDDLVAHQYGLSVAGQPPATPVRRTDGGPGAVCRSGVRRCRWRRAAGTSCGSTGWCSRKRRR
jgi:peptide/nickel transport system permease protein